MPPPDLPTAFPDLPTSFLPFATSSICQWAPTSLPSPPYPQVLPEAAVLITAKNLLKSSVDQAGLCQD